MYFLLYGFILLAIAFCKSLIDKKDCKIVIVQKNKISRSDFLKNCQFVHPWL